jgi:hypothetical protein
LRYKSKAVDLVWPKRGCKVRPRAGRVSGHGGGSAFPETPSVPPELIVATRRRGRGRSRKDIESMASNEEPILEEAMDNLREASQRIRATENRMLAAGMPEQPSYRNLFVRVSGALAMTEAALLEARRRRGV